MYEKYTLENTFACKLMSLNTKEKPCSRSHNLSTQIYVRFSLKYDRSHIYICGFSPHMRGLQIPIAEAATYEQPLVYFCCCWCCLYNMFFSVPWP